MAEIVIRPSLKFIKAGLVAVVIVVIAAAVVHVEYLQDQQQPPWLPAVAALLILWPLARLVRRLATKVRISGDKLYYESGLLSKSTRIIQLSKIQDVRANQTLWQRMLGVGDISIETAGESSRLVVQNLDGPQRLAEQLIEAAEHGLSAGFGV